MEKNNMTIGIFDSGMGGISVLAEAIKIMPFEKYIYFGDSKNAPYGEKTPEEVARLSKDICNYLIGQGVKAIVVACNTATSAAIKQLRETYDIPIIGMEPALKPAVEKFPKGTIAVMATNMTLKEKKFSNLMDKYGKNANIIKLPCPILVELVEEGKFEGEEVEKAILSCFEGVNLDKLDAVVLGCTHYIFLKSTIRKILGPRVEIIDGNEGTIRHLQDILESTSTVSELENEFVDVQIYNSKDSEDIINLSKTLLEYSLEN